MIGHKEFVYIADGKAASQSNRAQIDAAGGSYCFPLSETGHYPNVLRTWVLHPPSPLQEIRLPQQVVEEPSIGVGFEIDEIGIVEQINQLVDEQLGEIVSPGHAVKAMILNRLGLVSSPLYLFSKFFSGKATEHLIGE